MDTWQKELYQLFETKQEPNEFLKSHLDSSYFYHVSKVRSNIIAWFPFTPSMSVLEIDGGCGAISQFIIPKVAHFTLVEKDAVLLEIAKVRFEQYQHVEYLNEVNCTKHYDIIIINGAVELNVVRQYLQMGNKVLWYFDNLFGLTRFAGNISYGDSNPFESLYQSKGYTKKKVETFLQKEKVHYQFYYPYPDAYFTKEIYADNHLPNVGDVYGSSYNYKENDFNSFDEDRVRNIIIEQDMFVEFSNAYLVEVDGHVIL